MAQPLTTPLAAECTGCDRDVPCPKCRYNLRGLTAPRCPECGFEFDWSDLPRFGQEHHRFGWFGGTVLIISAVIAAVTLLTVVWPLFLLAVIVALIFLVAGVQALLELVLAVPIVGSISWPRFRAWWEGVIIAYAAGTTTLGLAGHAVSFVEARSEDQFGELCLFSAITAAEAILIQWWIVRRRAAQWEPDRPPRRLLLACGIAKLISAWLWLLVPLRLLDI